MPQLIVSVAPDSPAARAGMRAGDSLVAVNGKFIRDVLDYKYYSSDARLTVEYTRAGKIRFARIVKDEGLPLGLEFESYLMDKARSCSNKCVFCFIDQLPPGMRKTLYFKDDDARLSFLQGNYISLTNLSRREIERICQLHISPVNVSVQATDPDVRRFMLGNENAGECMDIMRRFSRAGICMNCQIVVCPGINDGEVLMRSMRELAGLYPAVSSVSVVPVGITRYREGLYPLSPVTADSAGEIIDAVDAFGGECLSRLGERIFCCADELFLRAGRDIPDEDYYSDYPQFENGVGMMRSLENEFLSALEFRSDKSGSGTFSVATGLAAAPLIRKLLQISSERCYNVSGTVYGIENRFFGSSVDVAGLITGGDLVEQLKGRPLGSRLLISASMLRHGGDMFLDSVTLQDASRTLGVPIIGVANDGAALLDAFLN
ncbi:MAG: DUF512 domain-containing protein [Oscillospiraceae bacterium]|nr:DUF512 domain-containing protein [Oscillospiraceae bacterium]